MECYIAYMGALIHAKKEKAGHKLFEKACGLTKRHKMPDLYVSLHTTLGDCCWQKGARGRLDGSKAFIAAMAKAIGISFEEYVSAGSQMFIHMMSIEKMERSAAIQRLQQRLEVWLREQTRGTSEQRLIQGMLWPLRMAERCPFELRPGHDFPEGELAALFEKELSSVCGPASAV